MKLTDRQRKILIGILRDRDDYAARTPRWEMGNWPLCVEREAIENAQENRVRTDPTKWLGQAMNPSLNVMVSRCYAQLQDKGLVMRCARAWSDRYTTHLRLTEEGERIAKELIALEAPTDAN